MLSYMDTTFLKVKVTNLKRLPKIQILEFKKKKHVTDLLKLVDKICKYEI